MKKPVLLLLFVVVSVVGCQENQLHTGAPKKWDGPVVTVTPKETDELLANPGMGWQTSGRFADEDKNLAGLPSESAYFRFYWCDIEPVEGQIDFARFDALLARARKAGQKFAFRVMCAGTGKGYIFVPKWLKDKGCKGIEYRTRLDGGKTPHWVPDMADPVFQKAHFRLLRELGKRYDGHPDLGLVDIGTVGFWGEWHYYGAKPPVALPAPKTYRAIIDAYCKYFPKTHKVMLIGHADALKYAIGRKRCGWRADCLGFWFAMGEYSGTIDAIGAKEAWKTAPVALESCWDMRQWKKQNKDIRAIFDDALRLFHVSYLNNKSRPLPEGEDVRREVERFIRKMGYRLVLRRLQHNKAVPAGSALTVAMVWENVGVAPPYGDYRLAFRLTNLESKKAFIMVTDASIKGWLPGKIEIGSGGALVWGERKIELTGALRLSREVKPGRYELALAVVEPETENPAVRLAITGRAKDGWYRLSTFEVVTNP